MEPSVHASGTTKKTGILGLAGSLCIGFAFLCFLLAVFACIFVFTELSEQYESIAAVLAVCLSSFLVGWLHAKKAKARGFLWGLVGGLLFGILLWLLGVLLVTEGNNGFSWQSVLCTSGSGVIGGIVGVNMSKK